MSALSMGLTLAGPSITRPSPVRRSTSQHKRYYMAPRERALTGLLPARNHRAGCAFLDYDNDGWMDIYLVNSGHAISRPNPPLRNALYRNNRDGTFTDVTEKAGVEGGGFGMGVAVGDYDGDGLPDLYVTQYGTKHPLPQQRRRHFH